MPDKLYKVGFYTKQNNIEYFESLGYKVEKMGELWGVYFDKLKPMTHTQALVFKSKMMEPSNHFLYEVTP